MWKNEFNFQVLDRLPTLLNKCIKLIVHNVLLLLKILTNYHDFFGMKNLSFDRPENLFSSLLFPRLGVCALAAMCISSEENVFNEMRSEYENCTCKQRIFAFKTYSLTLSYFAHCKNSIAKIF